MSAYRLPTLLLCLVLAACGGQESAEPMTEAEPEMAATPDPGMRPDASNPANLPQGEVPPGWQVRFDRDEEFTIGTDADSADVFFVTMTPGWHVTTEPAGVFWHPASTAAGTYRASTVIHLFPPGERNEGYGIVFGGSGLDGPDQSYLYFLIRRTGEFLVKRRAGDETEELIGWTAHESILPYPEDGEGSVRNELTVDVGAEQVRFLVNGAEVGALPVAGLETDGIVGLRINHALNVHVEDLSVEPTSAM